MQARMHAWERCAALYVWQHFYQSAGMCAHMCAWMMEGKVGGGGRARGAGRAGIMGERMNVPAAGRTHPGALMTTHLQPENPPTQSNRKKIGQWSKAHARRHVCTHLQTHAPVSTQKNHSLPSAPLPAPLRPPNTATHSLWTETTGLRTGFKRATQHKKHKNIKCN